MRRNYKLATYGMRIKELKYGCCKVSYTPQATRPLREQPGFIR